MLVWSKSGVAPNWVIADDYVIAAVEVENGKISKPDSSFSNIFFFLLLLFFFFFIQSGIFEII